jgi:MFS family permease
LTKRNALLTVFTDNNFWWLGNIIAGWTTYGANKNFANNYAWRIPTIVQAGMPAIVMVLILFFPESPRWLIAHDRSEEGLAVLAKYHGDGDASSPIVQLEYHEIREQMALFRADNPWWDMRELVNTRASRYRLYMVIGMSFFGQWSGNNVVSYFMVSHISNAPPTNF